MSKTPKTNALLRAQIRTLRAQIEEAKSLAFRQGYYIAVANIIRTHDEEVVAREVLAAYGAVDFTGIDPYDLKVLKPLAKEIERLRNLKTP